MFRLSISQFSTYRWNLFSDVLQLASMDVDGIGLWRRKVEENDAEEAINFVHEMELDVSSLSWAGGFTGSTGMSYIDAMEDAFVAVELAQQAGADCLIVHPGSKNGHTRGHSRRLVQGAFDTLVPFAEDRGVRLAIEPMQMAESTQWTCLGEMQKSLEFIERYPAERVGLVLDLYHVGQDTETLNHLDQIADRIALVQLADRGTSRWIEENRLMLGDGELPISAWLQRLHEIRYDGFVEVEIHGFDTELTPYSKLIKRSLKTVNQMATQIQQTTRMGLSRSSS